MAVVSAAGSGPVTVFSYRIERPVDWLAALGPDLWDRSARGPFSTPVPAGRWVEGAGFAVVAPLEAWNGAAILCGLRQEVPFDAVDAASAAAAARMIEMSADEGRTLEDSERQSAVLSERLRAMAGLGEDLAEARDTSALLARAAEDIAERMGAGAASIMVIEGDLLTLRASVGLSHDASRVKQKVGEGIAGWVAASGEKVVLRGRVADPRFKGTDPEARESVSVPLRAGNDVLGVLSVKRPDTAAGFAGRHELLDSIALDLGKALQAMNVIADLERERSAAHEEARVARAVAARDVRAALRAALELGHHAIALRDARGRLVAVEAVEGDDECRARAIASSAQARAGTSSAGRLRAEREAQPSVGFARHGGGYAESEGDVAQRTADTLSLLARGAAPGAAPTLRVLAVEDHPVMRVGLRTMLEQEGFIVAGATATCAEALGLLADARADVVLLDLHLPDAAGAEGVERIREAAPSLPIVVFSVERSPILIRAVIRAGANGYVTKDAPMSRLVAALHAAVAGLVVMGPEEAIAAAGASALVEPRGNDAAPEPTNGNGNGDVPRETLTPRELELLRYMAEGYTNKEVAKAMVLAEDTVKKAVQTLIAKLGAADRTHAVVVALRNHLID